MNSKITFRCVKDDTRPRRYAVYMDWIKGERFVRWVESDSYPSISQILSDEGNVYDNMIRRYKDSDN